MKKLPTIFLPHGGGPCFFMHPGEGFPPGTWDTMAAYLRGIAARVRTQAGGKPRAMVVVSGHWTEVAPTLYAPAQTKLLFDYTGFPEHTYQLTWPAKGDAAVATEVRGLLTAAGFATAENTTRGLDHGVFVPLKLVYPEADVPLVQLSLVAGYSPATHLALGQALQPLREQGVLIVASGMSYHNLRRFFSATGNQAAAEFDAWLNDAVTGPDPRERERKLLGWRSAPSAVEAHPEEEHLLPLLVGRRRRGR